MCQSVNWISLQPIDTDIYQTTILLVDGLPWPSPLPTPTGEVTRVLMLLPNEGGQLDIVSRLELAGIGDVGICDDGSCEFG
jgi:hypothetical protein